MTTARQVIAGVIVAGMVVFGGCEKLQFWRGSKQQPTSAPASWDSGKPDFQGHHLIVDVDGRQTALGKMSGGRQLWLLGSCSAAPTLKVSANTDRIGRFKEMDLAFYPVTGDKVDRTVRYVPYSLWGSKPKPGRHLKLKRFKRVIAGAEEKVKGLPAGDYLLVVQVNGEKTWDRQDISVTVK